MKLLSKIKSLFDRASEVIEQETEVIKNEKFPCKDCIIFPMGECNALCDRVEKDNKEVMKLFLKYNACPDCGSEKLYEGPCGGASQNVTCAGCGHRFNLGLPLFIERI